MYQAKSTDELDLRSFIRELLNVLFSCYDKEYDRDLTVEAEAVRVPPGRGKFGSASCGKATS